MANKAYEVTIRNQRSLHLVGNGKAGIIHHLLHYNRIAIINIVCISEVAGWIGGYVTRLSPLQNAFDGRVNPEKCSPQKRVVAVGDRYGVTAYDAAIVDPLGWEEYTNQRPEVGL